MITDDEVMRLFEQADPARAVPPDQGDDGADDPDTLRATSSSVVHGRSGVDLGFDEHGDGPATEDDVHHRPRRGGRPLVVALAAAAVLALVVGAVALLRIDGDDAAPITTDPPATTIPDLSDEAWGDVVWYDARGLHHGDGVGLVTPVEIGQQEWSGALALVRSGAIYLDPATLDVWFHPWGGEPRIVGHNSVAGPGGDPNGDTAAWFEGGELVVYDTAAGREISRTDQRGRIVFGLGGDHRPRRNDHYPMGNGFLQVSAERVVWTSFQSEEEHSLDLRTGRTSLVEVPNEQFLVDVHDDVEVSAEPGEPDDAALVLRVPGRAEERYPELAPGARLSPSGNYLLAAEDTEARHRVVIIDTRTGEQWPVPLDNYPQIAWSYGDIALVETYLEENGEAVSELVACDAARRACERLRPHYPVLLPTN